MAATRVTWQPVVARLEDERDYWLSTVASDGSPHVSPVWAAFVGDDCYLYSERRTVKARNLAADPRVVLHLGDATDVVIVHGHLDDVGHPRDHDQVLTAFASKYRLPDDQAFLPTHDPDFDVLYLAAAHPRADVEACRLRRQPEPVGRGQRVTGSATGPRGWRARALRASERTSKSCRTFGRACISTAGENEPS